MFSFLVSQHVTLSIHFDIAADVAALLLGGRWYDVGVNVWFSLIEVNFKTYDVFLAIHAAHELIAILCPLFNFWHPFNVPVMPMLRIAFIIHLLITECQLLHSIRTTRQDDFNVSMLLIGGTIFVLFEIQILKKILVAVV